MTNKELREWREARGLSQSQAARAIGQHLAADFSVKTLQNWEQGRRRVPAWLLPALEVIQAKERASRNE